MSHATSTTSAPCSRSACSSEATAWVSLANKASFAPSSAKARVMASPIPFTGPVIATILLPSFKSMTRSSFVKGVNALFFRRQEIRAEHLLQGRGMR